MTNMNEKSAIEQLLFRNKVKKVAVYGNESDLVSLLEQGALEKEWVEVVISENRSERDCLGLPVVAPNEYSPDKTDAVLIVNRMHELDLARDAMKRGWNVFTLFSWQHFLTQKMAHFSHVNKLLACRKYNKIALYGSGIHSMNILQGGILREETTVGYILDDHGSGSLYGIPVIRPAEVVQKDVDAVLISSDMHEKVLFEAAKKQHLPNIILIYAPQSGDAKYLMKKMKEESLALKDKGTPPFLYGDHALVYSLVQHSVVGDTIGIECLLQSGVPAAKYLHGVRVESADEGAGNGVVIVPEQEDYSQVKARLLKTGWPHVVDMPLDINCKLLYDHPDDFYFADVRNIEKRQQYHHWIENPGVILELTSRCNFQCEFCPRQFMTRKPGDMPLELFKNLVDQLPGFHKNKRSVSLHVSGEPLVHPDFIEMVSYLNGYGYIPQMVTNGFLINQDHLPLKMSTRFSMATDPDDLVIRHKKLDYQKYWHRICDYIKCWMEGESPQDIGVRFMLDQRYIDDADYMEGKRAFIDGVMAYTRVLEGTEPEDNTVRYDDILSPHKWGSFSVIHSRRDRRGRRFWLDISRISNVGLFPVQETKERVGNPLLTRGFCDRPFRQLVVLSDGRMVLCCQDFNGQTAYAKRSDIENGGLEKTWKTSQPVFKIRERFLQGKIPFSVCRECLSNGSAYYLKLQADDCIKKGETDRAISYLKGALELCELQDVEDQWRLSETLQSLLAASPIKCDQY